MIANNSFDGQSNGNINGLDENIQDQLMEIREQQFAEDATGEGFHQAAVSRTRAALDKVPNYAKPLQGHYPQTTKGAVKSHTIE